jgi:hypothetical protein
VSEVRYGRPDELYGRNDGRIRGCDGDGSGFVEKVGQAVDRLAQADRLGET